MYLKEIAHGPCKLIVSDQEENLNDSMIIEINTE